MNCWTSSSRATRSMPLLLKVLEGLESRAIENVLAVAGAAYRSMGSYSPPRCTFLTPSRPENGVRC